MYNMKIQLAIEKRDSCRNKFTKVLRLSKLLLTVAMIGHQHLVKVLRRLVSPLQPILPQALLVFLLVLPILPHILSVNPGRMAGLLESGAHSE